MIKGPDSERRLVQVRTSRFGIPIRWDTIGLGQRTSYPARVRDESGVLRSYEIRTVFDSDGRATVKEVHGKMTSRRSPIGVGLGELSSSQHSMKVRSGSWTVKVERIPQPR